MNPLLEQFLIEAREHLEFLDKNLQNLLSADSELINAIFRSAHTLKGSSALTGFDSIKEITHLAENILGQIRDGKLSPTQEIIDKLYDAFDYVVELVDTAEEIGEIVEGDKEKIEEIKKTLILSPTKEKFESEFQIVDFIDEVFECLESFELEKDFDYKDEKTHLYFLNLDLDENSLEVGNDPLYLLSLLDIIRVCAKVRCNNELTKLNTQFLAIVRGKLEEIEEVLLNIADEVEVMPLNLKNLMSGDFVDLEIIEEIKQAVQNNDLDKLKKLQDLLSNSSKEYKLVKYILATNDFNYPKKLLNIKDDNLTKLLSQQLEILKLNPNENTKERIKRVLKNLFNEPIPNDLETYIKEKLNSPKKTQTSSKVTKKVLPKQIKIDQSQIDVLMDLIGELLVIKNALPFIANNLNANNIIHTKREIISKYEEINRIVDELQSRVMDMRLVPLSYIFDRYPKLVRDLSKRLNKKIKLIIEGEETKLDKTVIEKLADPLVHVIRNSIDHGIEIPQERIEKGKSEEGLIKISANTLGDKVYIVIEDDGRGIDIEKVAKKALEKGLITKEELEKMSKKEKLNLIFLPGLSTKDEVSELSGRGVGMDAIKNVAVSLGGDIFIESEVDKGTIVTISIPVNVALSEVFHIKMNNINYAILMDYVVETLKIKKDEIKTATHHPYIVLRGEIIPIIVENNLIKREELKSTENVLIIKVKNKKIGLVVDEFVGELDIVAKSLNGILSSHPFINGVSLLGNGEILFLIDVNKIIK